MNTRDGVDSLMAKGLRRITATELCDDAVAAQGRKLCATDDPPARDRNHRLRSSSTEHESCTVPDFSTATVAVSLRQDASFALLRRDRCRRHFPNNKLLL